MNAVPVIFFGTHTFARVVLEGLIASPFIDVKKVITQPDRPVGRKQELQKSPVAICAHEAGIAVEQPESLKKYQLETDGAELFIVAQYGKIIPQSILDLPEKGVLNVHTSLLPAYRGASPIQTALINGDTETGVTIMKMDAGMDTGPILVQKKIAISPDDTYLILDKKMAGVGTAALLEAIPPYVSGKLTPEQQDDNLATTCRLLTRDTGRIDWNNSAQDIYNLYRGVTPWPGIWTTLDNKRLKLLHIKPSKMDLSPGVVSIINDTLHIGCASDSIEVMELQLEGKKPMASDVFIRGFSHITKSILT